MANAGETTKPIELSLADLDPAERLELLGNALADNDYDVFRALEQNWLDHHPDYPQQIWAGWEIVDLDGEKVLEQVEDGPENIVNQATDPETQPLAYARQLFNHRHVAETWRHGYSPKRSAEIIALAREQKDSEYFGAIDGHLLAALAANPLPAAQLNKLVHLVTIEAHDQALVGGQQLIDRLLESHSFDYQDLSALMMGNGCNYHLEPDRQPAANEDPQHWSSIDNLISGSHQEKQQLFEAIRNKEIFSPEWFSGPEVERLATDLDLTPTGREIFLGTDPVIYDLGSHDMTLGFRPDPGFFDDFARQTPSEQRQSLRQLDSGLARHVLDNLGRFDKSDGWYFQPPQHQIHLVKHPFKTPGDLLTAAGHELLHAADYHTDQDNCLELLESVAAHVKESELDPDNAELAGPVPKDLAGRIASSSNNHDPLFDRGGGGSELHFLQLVHQLPRIDGKICFQADRKHEAERFLSEAIAYLGTESAELPAELEDYCRLIFNDRQKLVAARRGESRPAPDNTKIETWRQTLDQNRATIKRIHATSRKRRATDSERADRIRWVVGACRNLEDMRVEISAQDYEAKGNPQMIYLSNRVQMVLRQALECIYDITAPVDDDSDAR